MEDAETIEEEIQDREEDLDVVVAENEDKKQDKKARQLNVVDNYSYYRGKNDCN